MGFIGWYLKDSAQAVRRSGQRPGIGLPVSAVMSAPVRPVDPETSITVLVDDYMIPFQRRSVPVVTAGRIVGIVSLQDLEGVRRDLWEETQVSEVMTRQPLFAVRPEESITAALDLIARHRVNQILVLDNEELVGVLTRFDILRLINAGQN